MKVEFCFIFNISFLYTGSCGKAPRIENGFFSSISFIGSNSIHGSTVQYRCLEGFEINRPNDAIIRCGPDGKWPSLIPACGIRLKLRKATTDAVTCDYPPKIFNGFIANTTYDIESMDAKNKDQVYYKCNPGYALSTFLPITCSPFGWSEAPKCKSTCGPTPVIDDGYRITTSIAVDSSATLGDSVTFACET